MQNARELTTILADLLRNERAAMAEFLVALADFDRRRLWEELGHTSLFYFLHRDLHLSAGAAHYRATAARLLQKVPQVVEPLRDGRLCLTSVVELAKVLTPENRDEILPRFFHCSKREAAAIAAAISPVDAAPRREVVTTLRAPPAPEPSALASPPQPQPARAATTPVVEHTARAADARQAAFHPDETPSARAPVPPGPAREEAVPLTAELRRLHVTVSQRFLEKLERARAALSHACPGGDAEAILEAGLDLLLAADAKKKGLVAKPRVAPPPSGPDHVPASVRREVWTRDQGRCQWPLQSGGVCGSKLRCEVDHRIPRARGGPSTTDNLRILCRAHNQLAARREFGEEWMGRYAPRRSGAARQPDAAECPKQSGPDRAHAASSVA